MTEPTPEPSPQQQPPTAGQVPAPLGQAPTTSTNAVIGLVLAILSWPLCPIIAAIPALILARSSDREIAASGGRVGGSGINTATRIIAWLNIGVSILAGIVIAVLVALGVLFSASVVGTLDPTMNSRTGLPDGMYIITPNTVVSLNDECRYGGPASMPGMGAPVDVTVYGRGPVECPDVIQVVAVTIEVEGGVARITRVE